LEIFFIELPFYILKIEKNDKNLEMAHLKFFLFLFLVALQAKIQVNIVQKSFVCFDEVKN
jgi:hypothetical protein